jgi:hypothetical protein
MSEAKDLNRPPEPVVSSDGRKRVRILKAIPKWDLAVSYFGKMGIEVETDHGKYMLAFDMFEHEDGSGEIHNVAGRRLGITTERFRGIVRTGGPYTFNQQTSYGEIEIFY